MELTEHSKSPNPINCSKPEILDLDLPIAIRKGVRSCTQHPIAKFVSYHKLSLKHKSFLSSLDSIAIPKTVEEVLQNQHWVQAMQEEMRALEKNNTKETVPRPKGVQLVGCRWVFNVKYNANGTLERYKTRLVAKGYTQTYDIDYLETFAPVAKITTMWILLPLASYYSWELMQLNVKNAFIQGDLEEVFMEPPLSFTNGIVGHVCRLKKAHYELK